MKTKASKKAPVKAAKPKRFSEGGMPNSAQRAFGPTIFQANERRKQAAIDGAEKTPSKTEFSSPPIKRQNIDPATKAKRDAQLRAMLKKHDASLD